MHVSWIHIKRFEPLLRQLDHKILSRSLNIIDQVFSCECNVNFACAYKATIECIQLGAKPTQLSPHWNALHKSFCYIIIYRIIIFFIFSKELHGFKFKPSRIYTSILNSVDIQIPQYSFHILFSSMHACSNLKANAGVAHKSSAEAASAFSFCPGTGVKLPWCASASLLR